MSWALRHFGQVVASGETLAPQCQQIPNTDESPFTCEANFQNCPVVGPRTIDFGVTCPRRAKVRRTLKRNPGAVGFFRCRTNQGPMRSPVERRVLGVSSIVHFGHEPTGSVRMWAQNGQTVPPEDAVSAEVVLGSAISSSATEITGALEASKVGPVSSSDAYIRCAEIAGDFCAGSPSGDGKRRCGLVGVMSPPL